MKDRVLVSTHDLERAGALRDAFRRHEFAVELVTSREVLDPDEATRLLVLTGPLDLRSEPQLLRQARESGSLPVMAFLPDGSTPPSELPDGVSELFHPSATPEEVVLVARRLLGRHRLQEATGIVGETDAMLEVMERVVQIAPVASTVLITGESGTGKELVARGIHALSPRRHKPFIAVNVAAISETLLESELFGHEKGAFTGAIDSRKGFFELAHGGTIFLDELGEMPLATQTKLLRVLEEREFLRVGGQEPIRVDVRIIAATNQDLRRLVAVGQFRKDLYYRLNVLHIELPPLRNRRADIPILVRRFVHDVTEQNEKPFVGISPEAMEILQDYHWPGNIRELRNLVESMVVLSPGREVLPSDIPTEVRSPSSSATVGGLVPAPIPRAGEDADASFRPQLEFIFRTLVDLRVDVDELKKEFEEYQAGLPALPPGPGELGILYGDASRETVAPRGLDPMAGLDILDLTPEGPVPEPQEEGVVVYRPGMTMEDLEREAIAAALKEVDGNRRKAADLLGIGERTLYRKIRKFELEE